MDRSASLRWPTWLLLPATAALVVSALNLHRHAWTGVSSRADGAVGAVEPGSPGARAGIRPGDRLRLPGLPAPLDPLAPDALDLARPGEPLVLARDRGGGSGLVWLAPEPLPAGERRFQGVLFAVASAFLLLGGWVWSERRDRLTRTFFLLCVAFAGWLAPSPPLSRPLLHGLYQLSLVGAQLLAGPLFSHFFALFPEGASRPGARAWVRALYAVAALLGLGFVGVEVAALGGAAAPRALPALLAGVAVLLLAGIAGGLAMFAGSFRRATSPDARRRLRVAFHGTLLGVAPLGVVVALHNLTPAASLPGDRWAVPFTLLVPAAFAWAIAVHRVFDFRVALRAGAAVAVAAALALLTYAAGELLAASWWPGRGDGVTGVALAFLALVAALAGP
ncbi:MAG TPA: hypothetical protein VGU27_11505, partial [Candidatus Eisenbacteria bacterium]|nr:hypothetical protein [Candidatus Eisenbacteria bacterium]